MSETLTLPAETRRAGKGASRALRREGRVPAVVYGGKEDVISIHVEEKELRRQLGTGHFFNSIVELEVGGAKVRTLPKDVAFHPVSDRPLHVDFLRLAADAKVHVNVPVHFINAGAIPRTAAGGSRRQRPPRQDRSTLPRSRLRARSDCQRPAPFPGGGGATQRAIALGVGNGQLDVGADLAFAHIRIGPAVAVRPRICAEPCQ